MAANHPSAGEWRAVGHSPPPPSPWSKRYSLDITIERPSNLHRILPTLLYGVREFQRRALLSSHIVRRL